MPGHIKKLMPTLGVHPHEARSVTDKIISDFRALAKDKKVVAIGEVGLDYYRAPSPLKRTRKPLSGNSSGSRRSLACRS